MKLTQSLVFKAAFTLILAGPFLTGCRTPGKVVDRSDAGIVSRIRSELNARPDLNIRYLEIHSHLRVVTLSGMVDSFNQKRQISDIARRVPGIRQLIVNLVVQE